jgi:ABC-type multidrug transport system ATPase subunit
VRLTIDGGQTLLDGVSFSARPGTLTAVIGPSGAGKSTLAKVIVGATQPSQGAVSFDGHDIHGAYGALCSRIGMVPCCRHWRGPTSRSCHCWWSRSWRSWCSPAA